MRIWRLLWRACDFNNTFQQKKNFWHNLTREIFMVWIFIFYFFPTNPFFGLGFFLSSNVFVLFFKKFTIFRQIKMLLFLFIWFWFGSISKRFHCIMHHSAIHDKREHRRRRSRSDDNGNGTVDEIQTEYVSTTKSTSKFTKTHSNLWSNGAIWLMPFWLDLNLKKTKA